MSAVGKDLFRGSEFSKLVILAVMILLGWPMVFYFGFLNKAASKPVNQLIATQVPLPAPDSAPEFKAVIDKEGRVFRDDAALAMLFKKVREHPEVLAKESRREVLPIDLLMTPWKYRGLPIRMEGFAQQVYAHDNEDRELVPSGRFYEVWFRSNESRQGTYPCCVFVEDIPKTMPGGKTLEERVALEGYFLKLYKYRAGDDWRFAPLFVGRIAHDPAAPPPPPQTSTKVWIGRILILLFVYVSIRVFFALRKTIVKRPRSNLATSAEQIEPAALQQWLTKPDLVDDEDK